MRDDLSPFRPSRFFPPAESANRYGVVAVGGTLHPEVLLDAYAHGIFPWPIDEDSPIVWASPGTRAIFEWEHIHIPHRLRPIIKRGDFQITVDRDFSAVIRGCATANGRAGATWITPAMMEAYTHLHELGYAHSVEAWKADELAGGVYGVALRGLFAAESMFYRISNASKVALLYLLAHLKARGYLLVDIQMLTPVTQSLGARTIRRRQYLYRLAEALRANVTFGTTLEVTAADVLALDETYRPSSEPNTG
ncbi:MAG: leucyl/phenylalanyl-tRNA--protein transferase [Thermogutta sp.]